MDNHFTGISSPNNQLMRIIIITDFHSTFGITSTNHFY